MKGLLITFEGIDGSGKTTQAKLLCGWFLRKELSVCLLREPGGTPLGERIRSALLDRAHDGMSPESELFLYLAARSQLTASVIRPSLESGSHVILDRFIDSTVAYQGFARGLGYDRVSEMNRFATGGLVPDITFFIDIDPSETYTRMKEAPDRLESEGVGFMSRVRDGYLAIAGREQNRLVRLEGSFTINEIHCRVVQELMRRFPMLQ